MNHRQLRIDTSVITAANIVSFMSEVSCSGSGLAGLCCNAYTSALHADTKSLEEQSASNVSLLARSYIHVHRYLRTVARLDQRTPRGRSVCFSILNSFRFQCIACSAFRQKEELQRRNNGSVHVHARPRSIDDSAEYANARARSPEHNGNSYSNNNSTYSNSRGGGRGYVRDDGRRRSSSRGNGRYDSSRRDGHGRDHNTRDSNGRDSSSRDERGRSSSSTDSRRAESQSRRSERTHSDSRDASPSTSQQQVYRSQERQPRFVQNAA